MAIAPRLLVLCFGVAACNLIACRDDEQPSMPEPVPALAILVDAAEERELRAQLDQAIEKNRTKRCLRPPLRGQPTPGPADQDILAVMSFKGPLTACARGARQHRRRLFPIQAAVPPLSQVPPESLRSLESVCAPLTDALARAVAHEDACSPSLPGREHRVDFGGLDSAASATILLARARARGGDARGAAELLLDFLRFTQDLVRGGGSVHSFDVTTSSFERIVSHLAVVLDLDTLHSSDIEALDEQVTRLIDSENSTGSVSLGELSTVALAAVRRTTDGRPLNLRSLGSSPHSLLTEASNDTSETQYILLTLAALRDLDARRQSQCPDEATWKDCLAGMEVLQDDFFKRELMTSGAASLETLLRSPELARGEEAARQAIRNKISISARMGIMTILRNCFKQLAWREAALLALRARLRARLGDCVGPELTTGRLGEPLTIVETAGGDLELQLPAFAQRTKTGASPFLTLRRGAPDGPPQRCP